MILIIVLLVIILIILLRYECLTIDDEPLNNLVTQINNKSLTIDNLNTSNITNKELKMFKIVIAQKNLVLYRDLKKNKTLFTNVVFK